MDEILRQRLVNSIINGDLVIFCGAGLSMAPPSHLPSAAHLTDLCVDKYYKIFGHRLDPNVVSDLESFSQHFLNEHNLIGIFLNRLVPWPLFTQPSPNSGHEAIADFLFCHAVSAAISTNYDLLIEKAANEFGENDLFAAMSAEYLSLARPHFPFLKMHGCANQKLDTLWCPEQLNGDAADRIENARRWLQVGLQGKDLVFLGFWTDWAYLNMALERALEGIEPSLVVLVDHDNTQQLAAKAPALSQLAEADQVEFHHVPESAADFLTELRTHFSVNFLQRLHQSAISNYNAIAELPIDEAPEIIWPEDVETLYDCVETRPASGAEQS